MAMSILDLLLWLVHFHCIEFFLVRVEGLRKDGILRLRCRPVEVFLRSLVDALPMLNHLRLFVVYRHHARLFMLQSVRKHCLVVLLLALLALEVHLLDKYAPAVAFFNHGDVLVSRRVLALRSASLLNLPPALLQQVVPLLQLLPIGLLSVLHLHQLLNLLLSQELFLQVVFLGLRLFLIFNLFALHGVLF